MGRHGCRVAIFAACTLLLAAAPSAFAAQEAGDAGDLPLTAQEAGPAGPLTVISGSTAAPGDRDMYKICLTGGGDFSATTIGGAGFDSQLFLFDANGMGVYANDDAAGFAQSQLPAGDDLTPRAAGVYYLAVSAFNWDPRSLVGPIFFSSGVAGPRPVGGALPISSWAADDTTPGGAYTITLTGARSCIDATPPTVDLRTPPDGASYARAQNVIADYSCADEPDGSGIGSCTGTVPDGEAIDTSTLGRHAFTVTAVDKRGNTTTVSHSYTVVDTTAPRIDLRTPPDGADYAQGAQVQADYSCADEAGGSGIASCTGTVADGGEIDTDALGEHSFTVTAVDQAGNTSAVTHTYHVSDTTPPTISLRTPADGASYSQGSRVVADYQCADEAGGSGLTSCEGTVADGAPIDTVTPGDHTFTVHSADAAGNESTKTATYRVEVHASLGFRGFLWPILNRPRVNVAKAGWILPMRFKLDGFHGRHVIAPGYPVSNQYQCGSSPEAVDGTPTSGVRRHRKLRFKRRGGWYSYMWLTDRAWAGQCRQFVLKLTDGSYHRADFRFPAPRRRR